MPKDLYSCHDKNMVQLLQESGYYDWGNSVTKDEIIQVLKEHPDFINDWLDYSSDQRILSGWYFVGFEGDGWEVGYFDMNKDDNFTDVQYFSSGYEASAVFIQRYVDSLSKYHDKLKTKS